MTKRPSWLNAARSKFGAGQVVGGYKIIRRLAVGGMAEIYLASREGTDRDYVVVKRMLPNYATDQRFVRMFLDEARIAARLDHPNIAKVLETSAGDDCYFVMEYVHGQDAHRLLRAAKHRVGRVPFDIAIAIGQRIASALHCAHEATGDDGEALRLIHRDVTPSNVLVTYAGGVKLLDFGIAKASITMQSVDGSIKGKMAYMSPEQCRAETLDRRSDVFSLGAVLFELSTGRPLYDSKSVRLIRQVSSGEIVMPSSLVEDYPLRLERIVLRALRADRDSRYQTAGELADELSAFADDAGLDTSDERITEFMTTLFARELDAWKLAEDSEETWSQLLERSISGKDGMQSDDGTEPPTVVEAVRRMAQTRTEVSSAGAERLLQVFLGSACDAVAERLRDYSGLDQQLRDMTTQGRQSWPAVDLNLEKFAAHVAARLPEDADETTLRALKGSDLYLACACLAGNPLAAAAFHEQVLPVVDVAVAKLDATGRLASKVKRRLRQTLWEDQPEGEARLSSYTGRTSLRDWLKVVALREAVLARRDTTDGSSK